MRNVVKSVCKLKESFSLSEHCLIGVDGLDLSSDFGSLGSVKSTYLLKPNFSSI